MDDPDIRPRFADALRQVVLHLVENQCVWYEKLLSWLAAVDRGDWDQLGDEMKLAHLNELEKEFYRRDGLAEYFDGSDTLNRAIFGELTEVVADYVRRVKSRY